MLSLVIPASPSVIPMSSSVIPAKAGIHPWLTTLMPCVNEREAVQEIVTSVPAVWTLITFRIMN